MPGGWGGWPWDFWTHRQVHEIVWQTKTTTQSQYWEDEWNAPGSQRPLKERSVPWNCWFYKSLTKMVVFSVQDHWIHGLFSTPKGLLKTHLSPNKKELTLKAFNLLHFFLLSKDDLETVSHISYISHTIHVWHIYLQLVEFCGTMSRYIYRSSHGSVMGSWFHLRIPMANKNHPPPTMKTLKRQQKTPRIHLDFPQFEVKAIWFETTSQPTKQSKQTTPPPTFIYIILYIFFFGWSNRTLLVFLPMTHESTFHIVERTQRLKESC